MAFRIRRVEYFTTTVHDQPGEAYKLLSQLADLGLNLVAFTAVPVGPLHAQLTIFPEDPLSMANAARKAGLVLDGPHPALLVQGDDELGALANIHATISRGRRQRLRIQRRGRWARKLRLRHLRQAGRLRASGHGPRRLNRYRPTSSRLFPGQRESRNRCQRAG